jgi:putative transposase
MGRVWEGKYNSCLLDENHLYEAIRYVELNPIGAKMETQIGDYHWSSYHEHVGIRNEVFLNKSPVIIPKSEWRTYLLEGLGDDSFIKIINTGTNQGKIALKNQ